MKALRIEVVYALPGRSLRRQLRLRRGGTVGDAIRASGLLAERPEIDLARDRVGIFGRIAQLDTPVREGDRVEIYRALLADPKQIRRERAKAGRNA